MAEALKEETPASPGDDLRWLSAVNRFHGLGESIWQTAARPWWDFLVMSLAMHYEIQAAEAQRQEY